MCNYFLYRSDIVRFLIQTKIILHKQVCFLRIQECRNLLIHKNMSIEAQKSEVDKVKRSENGVIVNPFFLHPQNTVKEADELMHRYRISGVPICDDSGKLVGILTNRDMRFMSDYNVEIAGTLP